MNKIKKHTEVLEDLKSYFEEVYMETYDLKSEIKKLEEMLESVCYELNLLYFEDRPSQSLLERKCPDALEWYINRLRKKNAKA